MFTAIGLKTQIWNNNIKSLLFLLLYPLLITALYGVVVFSVIAYFKVKLPHIHPEYNITQTARFVFLNFWYLPYILFFLYLAGLYIYNFNRLDFDSDESGVTRESNPVIFSIFEELCISRGIKTPYLMIKKHIIPNSYTTGISDASFCVILTSGLVEKLSADEIRAVLAHELVHIITRDTRLIFLTESVTKLFTKLSNILRPGDLKNNSLVEDYDPKDRADGSVLMFAILCYVIFKLGTAGSILAQILVSRKRVYVADAWSIELTKNPQALIDALNKIAIGFVYPEDNPAYIYSGNDDKSFFSTRPTLANRIKAIIETNRLDDVTTLNTATEF